MTQEVRADTLPIAIFSMGLIMAAQPKSAVMKAHVGFSIPTVLPEFPLVPRPKQLLTLEQEQSYGFQALNLTLAQIQAFACDTVLVGQLLDDIDAGFSKDNKAEKAVSLIQVDGSWVRHGAIPADDFASLARERIESCRASLDAMLRLNSKDRDLFYIGALESLRNGLAQIVPYDMILAKATNAFRQRCGDLSAACRELVAFVADEMHLSRPKVQRLCEQFWLSNKLPAICYGANRYVQSIMPAKAKRDFRFAVLERQQRIANVALETGVPIVELLASWSTFQKCHQRLDRLSSAFASFNIRLADKVAYAHANASDLDDVRSAAYQGLTRAISLYAPEKGLKFSTYAVSWIKQTIVRSLIQQQLIRLPEGSYRTLARIRAVYADVPGASDEYVCQAVGISMFELEGVRPFLQGTGAASLDSLGSLEDADGDLHEFVADTNSDFVAAVEEESEASYIERLLREALSEQEFSVIARRMGLCGFDAVSTAKLAVLLDTPRYDVHCVEQRAMAKLTSIPALRDAWGLLVS